MLHQTTNLGVRSSNLFGRANKIRSFLQERVSQKSAKRPPRDFPKNSGGIVASCDGRDARNRLIGATDQPQGSGCGTGFVRSSGPALAPRLFKLGAPVAAELLPSRRPAPYRFNADRAEKSGLSPRACPRRSGQ